MTTGQIILYGALAGGALWVLVKIGHAVTKLLEGLAAVAVVFVTLWLLVKGVWLAGRWTVRHPRSTLAAAVVAGWCWLLGWLSLTIALAVLALGLGVWWLAHVESFEPWAGRYLRAWWQRWVIYARRMPGWLRACGLTVADPGQPVRVQISPFRRSAVQPRVNPRRDQTPRVVSVRSGPSWDEVRVRLVAGQTPEDFDMAARALAVARDVPRCHVREIGPRLVSIDFERRNLLAGPVACLGLPGLATLPGTAVDLRRVWSGRTEYGTDWYQLLAGGHTLTAGATGAGKGSVMWAPIVSMAPAIRDGLVRVSGIDPKGMELAYGRRIFSRYAVTSKDALALLDDLIEGMEQRKVQFAGTARDVPITVDNPLELLEFDEIGALTRYVGDRKTREAIVERVALLNTQGRALGFCVRGYVQEPTKDTVPVRDLFPRKICLRVATKSHVAMVLGDQAYDRGAWANRIGEHEQGVGYLWGEGIREPLRIRAAWVPDETIKELEPFVTGTAVPAMVGAGQVLTLPAPPVARPFGGVA